MKNHILKIVSLFMAVVMLTISCTKDYVNASSQKRNTENLEREMTSYLEVANEYVGRHGNDAAGIVEVVNAYLIQNGKQEINLTEVQSLMAKYSYFSESRSLKDYFGLLYQDAKFLTLAEKDELVLLDEKMSAATSFEDAVKIMDDFAVAVESKGNLTASEKDKLTTFKAAVSAQLKYAKATFQQDGSNRDGCLDCISKNKWRIFGVSAIIVVAALIACTAATAGIGTPACIAIVAAAWAGNIAAWCGGACFGGSEPTNCTTCPSGWTYDGANCYSGACAPAGSNPFIYENKFYYNAGPGNSCSLPGSFYDGAHCFWGSVPAGFQPFILNNCYYVKAKCQ